jgi:hypothetical protein
LKDHFFRESAIDRAASFPKMIIGKRDPSRTCGEAASLDLVVAPSMRWYLCPVRFRGQSQKMPAENKLMKTDHRQAAIVKAFCQQSIFICAP